MKERGEISKKCKKSPSGDSFHRIGSATYQQGGQFEAPCCNMRRNLAAGVSLSEITALFEGMSEGLLAGADERGRHCVGETLGVDALRCNFQADLASLHELVGGRSTAAPQAFRPNTMMVMSSFCGRPLACLRTSARITFPSSSALPAVLAWINSRRRSIP